MGQFELSGLGFEELKDINGGNVCGTLGPQGSDPSIIVDAAVDIVKDVADFCVGLWHGLFGK